MLFEVQQNSNSTFRVYDWGRKGRALHLDEACNCIKFDDTASPLADSPLLSTLFFTIQQFETGGKLQIECNPETFQIFFHLERGETVLLPADSEPLTLTPGSYLKVII
jgi:mannose-6-phosphate isomerase